jgi:large subunit ribosomal protein L17
MFDTVAARFADRNGGYTRNIPAGVRPGDGAPTVLLELVDRPETPADKAKGKGKGERKRDQGEAGASGRRNRRERAAAASA